MQGLVEFYQRNTLQSVYKEVDTPLLFPFKQAGPYFSPAYFVFKLQICEKKVFGKDFYAIE